MPVRSSLKVSEIAAFQKPCIDRARRHASGTKVCVFDKVDYSTLHRQISPYSCSLCLYSYNIGLVLDLIR